MKNKTAKKTINFYTTYTDTNGICHYAVNRYNRINGYVTSLFDHIFLNSVEKTNKSLNKI